MSWDILPYFVETLEYKFCARSDVRFYPKKCSESHVFWVAVFNSINHMYFMCVRITGSHYFIDYSWFHRQ